MYVTKPYTFIRLGAIYGTKSYEITRFGATCITNPYKFIGFAASTASSSQEAAGTSRMPLLVRSATAHAALSAMPCAHFYPSCD